MRLFFFCLLSIVSITTPIHIDCVFKNENYYILKQVYSCTIRSVTNNHGDTHASGKHLSHFGSSDVGGLLGSIGDVHKFPKSLDRQFPNLRAIYFTYGKINELVADDLKPFSELVELYFDNCKIEVIEEGTFDYNPKLQGISFRSNRLFHIAANVFDHLTNLRFLWLNGNPDCPNDVARNDRNHVLNIIATAKSTCQSAAFLRIQEKSKSDCPAPVDCPVVETHVETCPPAAPCSKFNVKCQNINEIFTEYRDYIALVKEQCQAAGNQDYTRIIEEFEDDFGYMHSEFSHTLYSKFISFKNNLNC